MEQQKVVKFTYDPLKNEIKHEFLEVKHTSEKVLYFTGKEMLHEENLNSIFYPEYPEGNFWKYVVLGYYTTVQAEHDKFKIEVVDHLSELIKNKRDELVRLQKQRTTLIVADEERE